MGDVIKLMPEAYDGMFDEVIIVGFDHEEDSMTIASNLDSDEREHYWLCVAAKFLLES